MLTGYLFKMPQYTPVTQGQTDKQTNSIGLISPVDTIWEQNPKIYTNVKLVKP